MNHNEEILLSVRDLRMGFASGRSVLPAVDGVDFEVRAGEVAAGLRAPHTRRRSGGNRA